MPKKLVKSSKLIGGKKATRGATPHHVRIVKDTRPRNFEGNVRLENGLIEYVYGERENVVLWEDRGGRVFHKRPDGQREYVTEVWDQKKGTPILAGINNTKVYRPIIEKVSHIDGVERQMHRLGDPRRYAGNLHRYVVYGWNRATNKLERRGTYEFDRGVYSAATRYYNQEPYGHFVVEVEVR